MEGGVETYQGDCEDRAMEQLRRVGRSRKNPGAFHVMWADGQTTGRTPGLTAGPTEQPGLKTPEPTCPFKCPGSFANCTTMGENNVQSRNAAS